jgi:hypothetical protein
LRLLKDCGRSDFSDFILAVLLCVDDMMACFVVDTLVSIWLQEVRWPRKETFYNSLYKTFCPHGKWLNEVQSLLMANVRAPFGRAVIVEYVTVKHLPEYLEMVLGYWRVTQREKSIFINDSRMFGVKLKEDSCSGDGKLSNLIRILACKKSEAEYY